MPALSPVRRVRSLGAGAVAVIMGAAVLLVGPSAGPAQACSCMATTDQQSFDAADAVFRGNVVGYQPPPPKEIMSSGDPAVWTFAVTEVYKGDVAPSQAVISAVSSATCGIGLPHQGEFLVFVNRRTIYGEPTTDYHASLCGGTRSTSEGPLAVAGVGAVTTTVPAPPTTVARPPTTVTAVTTATTTVAPPTTLPGTPVAVAVASAAVSAARATAGIEPLAPPAGAR